MTPTDERIDELFKEIRQWPIAQRMAMALCVVHTVCIEKGSDYIDAGFVDQIMQYPIYLVFGRDQASDKLKVLVSEMLDKAKGKRTVIVQGDDSTPCTGPIGETNAD